MLLIRCPSCLTELDTPADRLGESIRCSRCQTEFVANAPDGSVGAEPAVHPRTDDLDTQDGSVRRQGRGRRRRFAIYLVVFLLLAVAGNWLIAVLNTPIRFSDSAWHEHAIPDGSASVDVPVTMSPEYYEDAGFGATIHKDSWESSGLKNAWFGFGVIDYPASDPITLEEVFRNQRDEYVRTNGGGVREQDLTVQDCPAKEFQAGDWVSTRTVYRIVFLQEASRKRFFLVLAGGRALSETDRSKFIESFRIKSRK